MLLIKKGNVHDGRLNYWPECDILVENGKIAAIGSNLSAEGAELLDASGLEIMPGFISALSQWGCVGPDWFSADNAEESNPVMPELDVIDGFDQDGMKFQRVFEFGITAAGLSPRPSSVIGGQMAVVKSYGRSPRAMQVRGKHAMAASVSSRVKKTFGERRELPMTRMGIFALLEQQLQKGAQYLKSAETKAEVYDAKAEAMSKVVSGELSLFINCDTRAEMDAVSHLLSRYPDVRPVYTGIYGFSTDFADYQTGRAAFIIGDLSEAYGKSMKQIDRSELIQALRSDKKVALSNGGSNYAGGKENLLWNAMLMRQLGLSEEYALRALSSTVAEILGVSDRIGSISVGLDADLVLWRKNPFVSFEAKPVAVYISGENVLTKEDLHSCW